MTTKRWLGNAAATFDVWTINLSGTVVSQTYSITINSKSVTYAAGGSDTVASILAGLVAAWTSTTLPPPPEFLELTPVVSGSTIVITANAAGNPATITVATGGAATYSITHTQSATGPNDFSNAQNWSGGVAPANSDTLVFDNGNVDCKYNLSTSLTGVTVLVQQGFSGDIGLPFINSNSQTTYAEYRTTALTLAGGTVVIQAPNVTRANFAFGSNTATVRVMATGRRIDQYTPVVLLTGGNGSSELDITQGDVGVAYYQGATANFPTIKTGYSTQPTSDVALACGSGTTLGTITQNGGSILIQSAVTTHTLGQLGGTLTVQDGSATTITALNGTIVYKSTGTLGTLNLYNSATFNCDQDPRAKTITNPINVYDSGVTILDNQKTVNSGVLSLATSDLLSVNAQHGGNTSIVLT